MKRLSADILQQNTKYNGRPLRKRKINKNTVSALFDWMQAGAVAIIAVVLIMTFVVRIVDVSGESMMNTLLNGDKVMVYSLMYTPKQGDIVIVSHAEKYDEPIVKRVIATEGQTIDIDYDSGKVYVDGNEIYEPYLTYNIEGLRVGYDDVSFPCVVPDNAVFVLGDNRPVSLDSRTSVIGFISCDDIIGKAVFVVYPFGRAGIVK
ncbi:MAG: signal peptidase I [Clostridiales bacterium]|nr:signal peptidase I [Clostridiales bacterium]